MVDNQLYLCLLAWRVPLTALAGSVLTSFPGQINPQQKYVFHTHGKVLEGNIDTPVNPERTEGLRSEQKIATALAI